MDHRPLQVDGHALPEDRGRVLVQPEQGTGLAYGPERRDSCSNEADSPDRVLVPALAMSKGRPDVDSGGLSCA